MKKVFDQTVRDIKREVNKKVLKVPGIEQKVLDATSNEPWGPHGTLLADIAQASRNYHEYQMIMNVLWKRINDTGKNWRHVYKALTVLEYLVAHGSERVVDEIREHAYQISTLSDFQYIDSSGKDQGNNVRRKSQSLVVLVNDKERIAEARQKAAANRDKFRSMSSTGGMYRPNPGGYNDRYDDDRYGGRYRDESNYNYDRDREWSYRDDDRGSRNGDSYSRDGDRYGRDNEDRYGRDSYRDDDYRGRSRDMDDSQYGPRRSRSSDRDRERAYDDDGQYSSRSSVGKADDSSQDGRRLDRKFSEQNLGAAPSYEEAVNESRSPAHSEREQEASTSAPKPSSPPASSDASQHVDAPPPPASPAKQEFEATDEFDPRGPLSAPPTSTTANSAEMDLLGSLSDSFAPNPLAIMPVTSSAAAPGDAPADTGFGSTFAAAPPASNSMNQSFEDPFGDVPFKAIPSADGYPVQQPASSAASFQANMNQNAEVPQMSAPITHPSPTNNQFVSQEQSNSNFETDILADILPPSGPLPATASQATFSATSGQVVAPPSTNPYGDFGSQTGPVASGVPQISSDMHTSQFNLGNFQQQTGNAAMPHVAPQAHSVQGMQINNGNVHSQAGFMAAAGAQAAPHAMSNAHWPGESFLPSGPPTASYISHMALQNPNGSNSNFQQGSQVPIAPHVAQQAPQINNSNFQQGSQVPVAPQVDQQAPLGGIPQNKDGLSNLLPQTGANMPVATQSITSSSDGALAIVPQPSKDKFETKSTVWADTLSRGLVNLNISGSKINPLADIGIDFDAINRKEKRMEKPSVSAVTSTVTMGKAMGSGSGMGRAGAGALRPPPNPMVGSNMGMGMGGSQGSTMSGMGMGIGGGQGLGMGIGGYGGMNQQQNMGMGMNMAMGMGMNSGYNTGGMGMNMGMGQGGPMQQGGYPPGSNMPGGYNPMGRGSGYPQQPYGGGYR